MKVTAKQLDSVLCFLVENKTFQYWDAIAEKTAGVDEQTASNIYSILKTDGYIKTEPVGSDTLPMAKILDSGVAFYNKGGYTKEKETNEREEYMKKNGYLRAKYWWAIALFSFVVGSILTPILLEEWKKQRQEKAKVETTVTTPKKSDTSSH